MMNMKKILPTVAFMVVAGLGLSAPAMAAEIDQNVPEDFFAAGCLIEKDGYYLLSKSHLKKDNKIRMTLPIRKKKYPEVQREIDVSGVNRDDPVAVARVVAKSSAQTDLGLPLDKVHVREKIGEIKTGKGGVIALFRCLSSAEADLNVATSQNVVSVEWVDPDTMENEKGERMPDFLEAEDRAFLQNIKHAIK